MEWTFTDVWEAVATAVPDRIAQVQGQHRVTWRDFDRRAAGVATTLLGAGLGRQDKVALYLHNAPAYLEAAFAAMKASLVPVNTNYRYVGDELQYLWTNADAAAVVFHGRFLPRAEAVRARCPAIRLWLHVDDGSFPCPSWAVPYETAAVSTPLPAAVRSGDDLVLIYTGGTTGMPRGVMWRQHDLFLASNTTGDPPVADLDYVRARLRTAPSAPVGLPAAPLMHGTGFVFAATILNRGGTVVTLANPEFDVAALLDTITTRRVTDLCIVGDAFCRPIVDALDAAPGWWDLSSLKVVSSSGMMWSAAIKARLLAHAPDVLMIDFLNSSEASGLGRSLTSARRSEKAARFRLGENAFVIDAENRTLAPGSALPGRLAVCGHIPLGYYKDPDRTAATFPVIDGVRCSVPGDYAMVEPDGSITLLGRGSVSINTGGEKVFPEEVEEAIKTFPGVRDAVVVGIPHERFGQSVAAAVEAAGPLDREALIAHLRGHLAGHKLPRVVMPVDSIGRAPNGKADYPATANRITAWLEEQSGRN
jgi:acyl-CoA synthetase (AMP-forming)/AMP-acid ligase II